MKAMAQSLVPSIIEAKEKYKFIFKSNLFRYYFLTDPFCCLSGNFPEFFVSIFAPGFYKIRQNSKMRLIS